MELRYKLLGKCILHTILQQFSHSILPYQVMHLFVKINVILWYTFMLCLHSYHYFMLKSLLSQTTFPEIPLWCRICHMAIFNNFDFSGIFVSVALLLEPIVHIDYRRTAVAQKLSQYRAQSCGIRSRWMSEIQIPSLRSKVICSNTS